MKKTYSVLALVFLLAVSFIVFKYRSSNEVANYKDITYKVEGQPVTLKDGISEVSIPNSSSKVVTRYFGNEVISDFDKDGRPDVAFLLTQNTGGSGTFYYVVVALNKPEGFVGGDATILGDRIAPQTTEINAKGFIVVNYADRKPGESFVVAPSVGKSIWFKFDPQTMQLGEVVQNFEGESR